MRRGRGDQTRGRGVELTRRLAARAVLTAALAFVLVSSAAGASADVVTLKSGDVASFEELQCTAGVEAGLDSFECQRRGGGKYEAALFRDNNLVWKVGNPDDPIFSTSGPTQAQLRQGVLPRPCGRRAGGEGVLSP